MAMSLVAICLAFKEVLHHHFSSIELVVKMANLSLCFNETLMIASGHPTRIRSSPNVLVSPFACHPFPSSV